MALVISDMSISLDGYVTGPNDSRENPFGDGAGMLHDWMFDAATDEDRAMLQAMLDGCGAVVMGRTSFEKNEGDGGWGDAGPVGDTPCFVVTHNKPTASYPPVFTFVTDGVPSAIEQAKTAAADKVVGLHGVDHHAAGTPARPGRRDPRARNPSPPRRRHPAIRHARLVDPPRTHPSPSYARRDAHRVPRSPVSHSPGAAPAPPLPGEATWVTRPHADDEPARHVTELSELAGMEHARANVWRYEPGGAGRRHRHPTQDDTFVVLAGTLSIYLGEPPQRHDVPSGSLAHVEAGTALQSVNHAEQDLVVYVHGWPPEDHHADLLPSAV